MSTASLSEPRDRAGLLLVFGGLPLVLGGGWLLVTRLQALELDCSSGGTDLCGVAEFFWVLGAIAVALGLAHFAAAVGVWRHRRWGEWLGVGLAVAWVLNTLAVLLSL